MDIHEKLPLPPLRTWTRQEYDQAVETGLFDEDERLELLEGMIVRMTPQRGPHSTGIRLTETALRMAFGDGFDVRGQMPLALGDASEPEPDVAVVAGSIRDYEQQHPSTAILVAEVADTSLIVDRMTKAGIYAKAGIPEYWIVNLPGRRLEVRRQPVVAQEQPLGWAYASVVEFDENETVSPLHAPDARIRVTDLLPGSAGP